MHFLINQPKRNSFIPLCEVAGRLLVKVCVRDIICRFQFNCSVGSKSIIFVSMVGMDSWSMGVRSSQYMGFNYVISPADIGLNNQSFTSSEVDL